MRAAVWVGVLLFFLTMGLPAHAASSLESLVDSDLQPLPKPQSRWGRDPFTVDRFEGRKADSRGKLALTAIISREGGGIAIINDQIVRQGDAIGGGRVTAILFDRVLVQERGRVFELRVEAFGAK